MTLLDLRSLPSDVWLALAQSAKGTGRTLQDCAAALLIKAVSDRPGPVSPMSLTPKQSELLLLIVQYQRDHGGVSPTMEEMTTALGLKSKSGVHRMLEGMEDRGAIRRLKWRTRAIEVLRRTA